MYAPVDSFHPNFGGRNTLPILIIYMPDQVCDPMMQGSDVLPYFLCGLLLSAIYVHFLGRNQSGQGSGAFPYFL